MSLIVMKFGGTAVADPEKVSRAAERAIAERRKGRQVVVVVSAPGEMTDDLIALAHRVTPEPEAREMDMLLATGEQVSIALFAMAVRARGFEAISLTGPQAGIEADARHTRARIVRIRPAAVRRELRRGRIVAVAGFQGRGPGADVVTLGRGGSDLTAVALAAALRAERCEIYTDVRGVYTADPRVVPEARLLRRIGAEAMLELSGSGAQVMQARSIAVAHRFGVRIHVRSAFDPRPGTWIVPEETDPMEAASVTSLALEKGESKFTIVEVPDRPGAAARILAELAREEVPLDMIVQSGASRPGVNDISFLAPRSHAGKAHRALERARRALGAQRVDEMDKVAKVSVVGTGFRGHPWVAARVFETLARRKINIQMIFTSDLRISTVVGLEEGETALRELHRAFNLKRA